MGSNVSTSLRPDFKATYDKIMGLGTTLPAPTPSMPKVPEVEHVPQLTNTQEIQYPTVTHQHRQISAFGNTQIPTIRGEAIGVFSPQKYSHSNHILLRFILMVGIILLGGYVVLWLKFFNLPLPF